jgi:hypothetical protein
MRVRPADDHRARGARLAVVVVAALLVAAYAGYAAYAGVAQRGPGGGGPGGFRGRRNGPGVHFAKPGDFDGSFQFCRVVYRMIQGGDGGDWSVDWPRADWNLSTRLSELTKAPVSVDEKTGEPNALMIQLSDPELFHCPFIMMTEVGNIYLDEVESRNLHDYLLKGGFLWADDFWGNYAWQIWESQIRKVLPSGPYPFVDLPLEHPIFHSVFTILKFPQIPGIAFWMRSGGSTSERSDSTVPHVRALVDERGRIMVLITHNTDFGDAFEEEATNHQYFLEFSVPGYAFGVNALVYSMTH